MEALTKDRWLGVDNEGAGDVETALGEIEEGGAVAIALLLTAQACARLAARCDEVLLCEELPTRIRYLCASLTHKDLHQFTLQRYHDHLEPTQTHFVPLFPYLPLHYFINLLMFVMTMKSNKSNDISDRL